jgi:hypothetical protein
MEKIVDWLLPIKTVSEANTKGHWTAGYKRHKLQKMWLRGTFLSNRPEITLPCHIILTRHGTKMDYDNLLSAMKYIRDEIAAQIKPGLAPGRADEGDDITWEYKQKPQRKVELRIEIFQHK